MALTSSCCVLLLVCCQVFDLEKMVKERDAMLRELKMTDAERANKLTLSLSEQVHQLQQQRSAIEQHYTQIINELNSRNEVLTAVLLLQIIFRFIFSWGQGGFSFAALVLLVG